MAYNPLAFGLMLVGSGALVAAKFVCKEYTNKLEKTSGKAFGAVFIIFALIAGIFGFNLYFAETIPAHYTEIYGVGYLLFTMLMLAGGITLYFDWDRRPASYLAALGGIILLNSARTVYTFSMSKSPMATTATFALAGLGAIGSLLYTHPNEHPLIKDNMKWITYAGIAIFAVMGLLALYSGLMAQFGHVARHFAEAAAA